MNNLSHKQEKICFGQGISRKNIEFFTLNGEKGIPSGKISNSRQSLTEFFDQIPAMQFVYRISIQT